MYSYNKTYYVIGFILRIISKTEGGQNIIPFLIFDFFFMFFMFFHVILIINIINTLSNIVPHTFSYQMNSSKATDYVVPEEFRGDALLTFSSWINSISAYLYLTDFIISFIGIFPSLFHFWILTRTYMRHLTTNLFLIGITVCGIIHIICNIIEFFPMLYDYYLSFKVPSEW